MKHCQHMRQRRSTGEVSDPLQAADDLLPCAVPDCDAGVPGQALVTPEMDGDVIWRRVKLKAGPCFWGRVTGTAKIGGVE